MITLDIKEQLKKKGISVTELSEKLELTMANASLLKNGKVKGVRFSTLDKLCEILDCQPGNILHYRKESSKKE
jgi:putative transcriptional regulator